MYMVFLFASLAASIGIQIVLGFPTGLIVSLAIFIAFPLILRRIYAKRVGGYGRSGVRDSGFFGLGQGGSSSAGNPTVKYVCLVCNNRYKGGSCPRCGSKMKRADF
jgi:hypothetical protein